MTINPEHVYLVTTHSGSSDWVDGHELLAAESLIKNYSEELRLNKLRQSKITLISLRRQPHVTN